MAVATKAAHATQSWPPTADDDHHMVAAKCHREM